MEADYWAFIHYSPFSNEITLEYSLNKNIPGAQNFTKVNLDAYNHEFSSNINKNKFFGYITISKNSTFRDLKFLISRLTGIPANIMVRFGYWGGTNTDKYGGIWTTIIDNNDIKDDTKIMDSRYYNNNLENRKIYIYIDMNKDQIFSTVNNNQIMNDIKI